jgi:DNA-binding MarR family transcriptional regulator
MTSIEVLKILMTHLEAYEQTVDEKDQLSVEGLLAHIYAGSDVDELTSDWIETGNKNESYLPNNVERVIAQHLLITYRYIKFYGKIALLHSPIRSLEEFAIMATLLQVRECSKSELIRRNIFEKSSGIELINRLIKAGLLEQVHHPTDMRTQLIRLTSKGVSALTNVFQQMDLLGRVATAPLQQGEKLQLAALLKKLDAFHFKNYHEKNAQDLSDYLPEAL